MMRSTILVGLVVAGAGLLGSCGGSGGLGWEDYSRTYETHAVRDGFVRDDLMFWNVAGGPVVGDIDGLINGRGVRMIYSFETGGISNDAEIQSARLMVYQESVDGNPGSAGQGNMLVDHIDMQGSLDGADWNGGTITANIGILSSNSLVEWKSLDVTAAVQESVSAGRTFTDFRLHYAMDSNTNTVSDHVRVNDGADTRATGNIPHLIVEYRAPRL